jgi:hypothetical protein
VTLLIYLKKITGQDANISIFRDNKLYKKYCLSKYLDEQQKNDIVLLKFSG